MRPEAKQRQKAFYDQANQIEMNARSRMPQVPDNPTDENMRAFLDAKIEDYMTPEEKAEIDRLNAEGIAISDDPANFLDPNSYLILDPSRLRSPGATFDPAQAGSSDILSFNWGRRAKSGKGVA
jgi:hypothetical protein